MIMDTASQEIYFQKIQELVKDDDKIVTVYSLASDLNISLQNSRNLISKYVEDQRQLKLDWLAVTYVLSGILKENGKKGIFMIKETDLEQKRNLFEPNPYQVIYSVQKNKNVDFNIIALVDMFDSTKIRDTALNGSIVSKNCIKRTLKFKKLPSPPRPTVKGKSSFFAPKTEGSTSSEKLNAPAKTEQKAKASGGIADLFKTAAAVKPKNGNNSTPVKSSKPSAKLGGLAGFFTNGTLKSPKNTTKNNAEIQNIDSKTQNNCNKSENQIITEDDKISDIMDVEFDEKPTDFPSENIVKREKVAPRKKEKEERKSGKQERQKPHKRQRDKSKELPSKRRKRIIERNDSDSDDIFEKEDDNDDIIEKSDEEVERVPSPVAQKFVVPKNKRRKAVTKNYEDEEGFIVTKTEYVYESASEDENVEPDPPKQQKEEKALVKSKVTEKKQPAKSQSTLMNFFKKK